jgi:hypothetical protein
MTVLPAMPSEQTASWLGVLDLYDHLREGWTLIGGQLVHLHCAGRGQFPVRPTNDADTVIDVRADPKILHRFTKSLTDLGFKSAGISAEGRSLLATSPARTSARPTVIGFGRSSRRSRRTESCSWRSPTQRPQSTG